MAETERDPLASVTVTKRALLQALDRVMLLHDAGEEGCDDRCTYCAFNDAIERAKQAVLDEPAVDPREQLRDENLRRAEDLILGDLRLSTLGEADAYARHLLEGGADTEGRWNLARAYLARVEQVTELTRQRNEALEALNVADRKELLADVRFCVDRAAQLWSREKDGHREWMLSYFPMGQDGFAVAERAGISIEPVQLTLPRDLTDQLQSRDEAAILFVRAARERGALRRAEVADA